MTRDAAASPPERRPYVALRSSAEFSRVYRKGSGRRVEGILVISAPGQPGRPRVGFVAGRRVGGAVVRNRAKRRMREALAGAELREATSYIIVALPSIAEAGFSDIAAWVRRAVRQQRTEKRQ